MLSDADATARATARGATATGFDGRQSCAHTSDTSQILPRSWGLAVRELLLAARPKFTWIYVGNGLRFAEIRLSRLKKHTHTHTSDTPCTTADQRIRLWSPGAYSLRAGPSSSAVGPTHAPNKVHRPRQQGTSVGIPSQWGRSIAF